MHDLIPPQKVVSRRMTSTAVSRTFAASCSKFTTTVLVARGTRTIWRVRRMACKPKQGISRESGGDSAVDFKFVIGVEDAGLDFMGGEAEAALQRADVVHHLLDGT